MKKYAEINEENSRGRPQAASKATLFRWNMTAGPASKLMNNNTIICSVDANCCAWGRHKKTQK